MISAMRIALPVAAAVLLRSSDPIRPVAAGQAEKFDLLIKGATVIDGSGKAGFVADIGIRGDRIAAIGRLEAAAARTVDAAGLVACPGFIDMHTHCDTNIVREALRPNLNYLHQGVTTVVTGNCGFSPADTAKYLKECAAGTGTNVAHLVGHGAVREHVMGTANRAPTPAELEKMKQIVRQAMQAGAVGLSTGLFYTPGSYAETSEVIELAKVAAEFGGIYNSHIRHEDHRLLDAIREAIEIGRKAGIPVQIAHIKCTGMQGWGRAALACELIENARREGLDITADQYPYPASSTGLIPSVLPGVGERGAALKKLLAEPESRARLSAIVEKSLSDRLKADRYLIARFTERPEFEGKKLSECAEMLKLPAPQAVLKMLEAGSPSIIAFGMKDEDVEYFMQRPWVFTSSDGGTIRFGEARPHPRSYGSFPRKLRVYALDKKLVSLEAAIRSATDLPAKKLRLEGRGLLAVGYFADIVLFDPRTVADKATFVEPHQFAAGIPYVLVNGKPAIDAGKYAGLLPGRVLRPEGPRVKAP
jgi:N-acyl-D-aspartate/D-glutamate deacylase